MAKINPLETDVSFVSKLDDEPNDVGGLTPEELKAVFDKSGEVLKKYINEVVVDAINTMKANEVAFERSVEVPADTVQQAVENVRDQMKESVLGQVPDASIGLKKLTQEVLDRSYTKEETLTSATCTAFGMEEANPDDIFGEIQKRFDAGVKIAAGSYVGTGTYGESNPNSLTFDFEPKILFINGHSGGMMDTKILVHGASFCRTHWYIATDGNEYSVKVPIVWNGNAVSWYSTSTDENWAHVYQMNVSGTTYRYVAFG